MTGRCLLALALMAAVTLGLSAPASGADPDQECGDAASAPVQIDPSRPRPDFRSERYDMPLNPTCAIHEQLVGVMKISMISWSVGMYRGLYYASSIPGTRQNPSTFLLTGARDAVDAVNPFHKACNTVSEPPPDGLEQDNTRRGFNEQPLLQGVGDGCNGDVMAWIRDTLLGGAVQKPTATDVIFKNPSNLTYDNRFVVRGIDYSRAIGVGLLGVFLGLALVRTGTARFTGSHYPVGETVWRIGLGTLLMLFWPVLARGMIELASALSMCFGGDSTVCRLTTGALNARTLLALITPSPASDAFAERALAMAPAEAFTMSFYAFSASLLAIIFVVRIFIIDVALVVAPLVICLLMFPDTRRYVEPFAALFIATLYLQPVLVVVLALSAVFVLGRGPDGVLLFEPTLRYLFGGVAILGSLGSMFALTVVSESFSGLYKRHGSGLRFGGIFGKAAGVMKRIGGAAFRGMAPVR